jgi:ABC-type sugar transport system ATPase subunit
MAALTSAILSDTRAGSSEATRAGARIKLSIRSVGKSYGAVAALADASLELAEGELLTLLGPSGSGKTTLLMTVAGLVPPSSGEIWIDGELATYVPPDKRDIGIVFQNYALFPHHRVREHRVSAAHAADAGGRHCRRRRAGARHRAIAAGG